MKKHLLLLLAFCTFAVQAQQFQNPFKHRLGKFAEFGATVSVTVDDGILSGDYTALPEDTIMPLGDFILSANLGWFGQEEHTDADVEFLKTITADFQIHDYYGRNVLGLNGKRMDSLLHYQLPEDIAEFIEDVEEAYYPEFWTVATDIAGHYNWSWTANNGIEGMSGHVQFNADPKNSVWGQNGSSKSALIEFEKLTILSEINTGFPYDGADYQGKAKYTVYDPDSVEICQKEIDLRISPDSTMNGQIQKDIVCEIDSARHGTYRVVIEAPFLAKAQSWRIEVVDPLADASSLNPVDATYRLAESNFKEAGKGKGWNYSGSVPPSYYTDPDADSETVMIVRPDADGGDNAFTLTQTVNKMPPGFYTLSLPVAYQPCAFSSMQYGEEILAFIDANGVSQKAKHIMAGATKGNVKVNGMDYTSMTIPSSDQAFAYSLRKSDYKQKVVFEVKEDSLITIGVHKNHTDSLGEITAIGAVDLVFYGAALPYGKVLYPETTEFVAGDSLKTTVQLFDGLSGKVPADNQIMLLIAPLTEQGTIDRENILLTKEEEAGEAGKYDMSVVLPDADKCPVGNYVLIVASLEFDGKFEVEEKMTFKVKGATAIEEVKAAAVEAAPVYNLSGVRQSSNADVKGIYVQGGKKYIK